MWRGPVELPQAPSAASWSLRAGACLPAGSQLACGVSPAHRRPCGCTPVLSRRGGPRARLQLSQELTGSTPPPPKAAPVCAPPPDVRNPKCVPPAPGAPRGCRLPPPGPPGARPARDPAVRPLPSSLLRLGAARGPDPDEAQAPRPQVRRVTGRAGSSSRGRGHCRSGGRPRGSARTPGKAEHARRPLPCWWAPSGGA